MLFPVATSSSSTSPLSAPHASRPESFDQSSAVTSAALVFRDFTVSKVLAFRILISWSPIPVAIHSPDGLQRLAAGESAKASRVLSSLPVLISQTRVVRSNDEETIRELSFEKSTV